MYSNKTTLNSSEILWPPLYTVKWTREHIPIVFFTERHHSEQSALGLTGSYETGRIAQAGSNGLELLKKTEQLCSARVQGGRRRRPPGSARKA